MTTIIIFASSLFVALVLLLVKAVEIKFSRKNIILQLIGKFDSVSAKLISALKFKTLQLIQSIRYIILVKSRDVLRDFFYRMEEKMINEYKTRQSTIMGRKEILSKGSVSFYLKKITEEKGNIQRGKIEQTL